MRSVLELQPTSSSALHVWWDSYCDTHADPMHISWEEFSEAFGEHHMAEGMMDAKVEEFRNISQGSQKI